MAQVQKHHMDQNFITFMFETEYTYKIHSNIFLFLH